MSFLHQVAPVGESMILPRFYGKGQTSPLFLPCRYAPEDFGPIFIHSFAEDYRKICAMKEQIIEILNCYKDTTPGVTRLPKMTKRDRRS